MLHTQLLLLKRVMTLSRRIVAEVLGTAFLLAAVVGSGIMGERLANGNIAIALLANTLATGATLVTLIFTFRPISGAHFNPAVTLLMPLRAGLAGAMPRRISSPSWWAHLSASARRI